MAEKKTPKSVIVVAVILVVAAAAFIGLWAANPPFVARMRASYYAGKIGEGASNGALAKKMIDLGKDAALPATLRLLKSEDRQARKHALIIIDKLHAQEAADAVVDAMKKEKETWIRLYGVMVIAHLFVAQPEHCDKVVPFLFDEDDSVSNMARGTMMKVSDLDIPGRTNEQWAEWWKENKERLQKKAASSEAGSGAAGTNAPLIEEEPPAPAE